MPDFCFEQNGCNGLWWLGADACSTQLVDSVAKVLNSLKNPEIPKTQLPNRTKDMDLSMDFPITNCRIDCKTKLHDNKPYPVEIKVVLNTGWVIEVNDQKRIDAFAVATDFSATG